MRIRCGDGTWRTEVERRYWLARENTIPDDLADWDETCPGCGKDAVYSRVADRFFHEDGSANMNCWLAFHRSAEARP